VSTLLLEVFDQTFFKKFSLKPFLKKLVITLLLEVFDQTFFKKFALKPFLKRLVSTPAGFGG